MPFWKRSTAFRYSLAPLCTVLALLVRVPFWPWLGANVPNATFLPAVMISAWLGGVEVGLVTTVLSALTARFFFIQPIYSFAIPAATDSIRMLAFIALGAFVSVFTSALQKARSAAAESEQNLTSVLESITDGLAVFDRDYNFVYVNAAAERILARPRKDLLGRNYWTEFPQARVPVAEAAFARVMKLRAPEAFEHLYEKWNRWVDVRAYPHRAGGISVYFKDVTARKRQVEDMKALIRQLDESRAVLNTLFEQAPIGFGLLDTNLRFVRVNRALAGIDGIAPEAHIGKTIPELLPELDPEVAETFARVLSTGEPVMNQEARGKTPAQEGDRFWSVSSYPVAVDGESIGVGAMFEEITARKEAEQALRKSEATFRQIAETMPQLVWTTGPQGDHDYFNQGWRQYTGLTFAESEGDWPTVLHPDDRERTLSEWRRSLETGEPYHAEYRLRARDGGYRWFLGRAVPILNEGGRIVRWFGTCTDIDDQKKNEEALRRANSDLEQFAYSASHDLREPLRNVAIYTQLLEKRYGAEFTGDAKEYLRICDHGRQADGHIDSGSIAVHADYRIVPRPASSAR